MPIRNLLQMVLVDGIQERLRIPEKRAVQQ